MGAAADPWDEVWAEYDARQPAAAPRAPAAPRRARRWPWRGTALAAAVASFALLATPMAAAVNLVHAVQARDVPAVAALLDRPALAGALEDALRRDAATHLPDGLPPFLDAMAGEVAQRLAAPEGLAAALAPRGGSAPAHHVIRDVVPLGLDRWAVTLADPARPQRRAEVTLSLAGPLRWQVIGVSLPR